MKKKIEEIIIINYNIKKETSTEIINTTILFKKFKYDKKFFSKLIQEINIYCHFKTV